MSVKKYKDFFREDIPALMEQEEYFGQVDGLQLHLDAMIIEGKNEDEINESFNDIFKALGGGFKQTLYQYAAEWLMGRLGIPTKNAEGKTLEFVKVVTQIVSKIEFTRINNYFGKGACPHWAKAFQEGLISYGTDRIIRLLLGSFGFNVEESGGIVSTLELTLANTLSNYLHKKEFVLGIEKAIAGKICGEGAPGFSEIFKGKSLDPTKKEEMSKKFHQVASTDPSLVGQAKQLGILNLFGFGNSAAA